MAYGALQAAPDLPSRYERPRKNLDEPRNYLSFRRNSDITGYSDPPFPDIDLATYSTAKGTER